MSSGNGEDKKEQGYNFGLTPDGTQMQFSVPIEMVARDESINGLIFLLGFFEHCRNEALAIVRMKRVEIKKSGLIVPQGSTVNPDVRVLQ